MKIDIPKYYYYIKPILPRKLQIFLRRKIASEKLKINEYCWPINEKASKKPVEWIGWPENKKFALVLTHDVDTAKGHDSCLDLAKMEMSLGFRSCFNFVAGEYAVSNKLREYLVENDFEVGIHGLYHNNLMYKSKEIFNRQAIKINKTLKSWKAVGFRSPCMYHKLDWLHDLDIEYDASTFDTDPFEPQPEGVTTIFPFFVSEESGKKGYVELPYTLPQDFTLFILLNERSNRIWNKKLNWIVENGGMALINTHPDYMNFKNQPFSYKHYPAKLYENFLITLAKDYKDQYWHALPKYVASFWRKSLSEKSSLNITKEVKVENDNETKIKEINRIILNESTISGEDKTLYEG
ncbi:MAG TPA: hypothetical protein VGL27_03210 [Negativicutes bacterium]|jgi:hypothetical protein